VLLTCLMPAAAASAAVGAVRQPETCPSGGAEPVAVVISAPEPGLTLSGEVRVEGTASSFAPVFRVELFVGDARKDVAFSDTGSTETGFTLVWDTGSHPPGPATLRVVACAGSPEQGSLARGESAVDVIVAAPAEGPGTGGVITPAAEEEDVSRRSLRVGLVVGVAGLVGLVLASGPARRSRRAGTRTS
jgi:Bacterial Ig domain